MAGCGLHLWPNPTALTTLNADVAVAVRPNHTRSGHALAKSDHGVEDMVGRVATDLAAWHYVAANGPSLRQPNPSMVNNFFFFCCVVNGLG